MLAITATDYSESSGKRRLTRMPPPVEPLSDTLTILSGCGSSSLMNRPGSYWPKRLIMPRGPRGEKRPADVIGNAVHVMRIATGEIEDKARDPAKAYARKGETLPGADASDRGPG